MTSKEGTEGRAAFSPYRLVLFGANGVFGRRVLKRLSSIPTLKIGAACRTKEQAVRLAREFGSKIDPLWGDARNAAEVASLAAGAQGIFHCAGPFSAQPLLPLEAALNQGLDYADLGDDLPYLQTAAERIESARPAGKIFIPGASSLPSMTSLLVRIAEARLGPVERAAARVFIGNQNPKGWGPIEYLIRALRAPFQAMRNGAWTPLRTWEERTTYESRFHPGPLPYNRVASPDDYFLPRWFGVKEASFQVSLEFRWIHQTIGLIAALQKVLPSAFDRLWVNLLFYSHPWMKWIGTRRGWLEMETAHPTDGAPALYYQNLSAFDEGQRVPTFPMILIGRILAGEIERPIRTVTRFFELLPADRFLAEIKSEGIAYLSSLIQSPNAE
jgi:hypothetical protein